MLLLFLNICRTLQYFRKIVQDNFWSHVIFDVSFAAHANTQKQARRWIEEIRGKFPSSGSSPLKTVFLDIEDQHAESFRHNLQDLWDEVSAMGEFECKDMKAVLAQNDQLEAEKRKVEEEKKTVQERLEENVRQAADEKRKVEERLEAEKRKIEERLEGEKRAMGKEMEEEKKRIAEKLEEETKRANDKDRETGRLQAEIQAKKEIEKEHEAKVEKLNAEIKAAEEKVREKDREVMKVEREAREKFEKEKMDLVNAHQNELAKREEAHRHELDKKVQEARRQVEQVKELEVNKIKEVQEKEVDIRQLRAGEDHRERYLKEEESLKAKHNSELKEKDEYIRRLESEKRDLQTQILNQSRQAAEESREAERQKEMKEKEELVRRAKEEKEEHKQKVESFLVEAKKSDKQFEEKCPALLSKKDEPSPGVSLIASMTTSGPLSSQGHDFNVPLRKDEDVKNRRGGIAARVFNTNYPRSLPSAPHTGLKKTVMLLGMTGTGKTTFIDALTNYIFDIRYEDENRLRLVSLTKEEKKKQLMQAQSQTDSIVVYNIKALSGMNIRHDLTIIDSPGFGDTRGVDYDKKLMQNIEDLFKSKRIDSLDAIGFVAKAGDARLTAQQRYIFESVLHIFGKNVKENLLSVLTCYDGHSVNILDSFEEADMNFAVNFPVNSEAVLQPKPLGLTVDKNVLINNPHVIDYQNFFNEAERFAETLIDMAPRPLEQTLSVLQDRECIEVELQGLQENVQRLLVKRENIRRETEIYKQHQANKDANENSEYEVEEHALKKVQLEPGTYVTNCLKCNFTCHYPCAYANDADKIRCSAMRNGKCTACPKNCKWDNHVNNQHRIEFETKKVTKTYTEIYKRFRDFGRMVIGMEPILEGLKREAEEASNQIQASTKRIIKCQESLQMNALRTSMGSSSDYFEQLISAEQHEKKPGYLDRVKLLW